MFGTPLTLRTGEATENAVRINGSTPDGTVYRELLSLNFADEVIVTNNDAVAMLVDKIRLSGWSGWRIFNILMFPVRLIARIAFGIASAFMGPPSRTAASGSSAARPC